MLFLLTFLGLPQQAIMQDHSYLTITILLMWVGTEGMMGVKAWNLSKEHKIALDTNTWLQNNPLTEILIKENTVILLNRNKTYVINKSETARHIASLVEKHDSGSDHIDQTILINSLEDHLYKKIAIGEFISSRIVWIGILATILGVIMAFWPLMGGGGAIDAMKANIGLFFSGIAVAFIPTAVSFVIKIALDFNTRILESGVEDVVDVVSRFSDIKIISFLEGRSKHE
jgi:biopolymer transport protein ExbB/TolQ